jgi:hypothetical protein
MIPESFPGCTGYGESHEQFLAFLKREQGEAFNAEIEDICEHRFWDDLP